MPNGKGLLSSIEEKLGLPPIGKVTEALQKFPDMPRLRLIKSILDSCERLIADTPTEKLEKLEKVLEQANKLEKVLKQANKLVAHAPNELLEFLSSLKEA